MDSRCGCSWSTTTRSSAGRCASRVRARGTPSRRRSVPPRHCRASRPSIPDVVVLDVVLPDLSGFDVCREIRRAGHRMPRDHPERQARRDRRGARARDRRRRLHRQAVPAARAARPHRRPSAQGQGAAGGRQAVRRTPRLPRPRHRHGRASRDAAPSGTSVLTHTEFDLLSYLASNAGKVLSRERILSAVWGYEHPIETRVIDVHVRNLRRKIEPDPAPAAPHPRRPGHRLPIRRVCRADPRRGRGVAAKYTRHGGHSSDARPARARPPAGDGPTPSPR